MNKLALVTGGTSGIGYEYCKTLSKNGYDLIVTGRREDILIGNKAFLEQEYRNSVQIVIVDFTNRIEFEKFINNYVVANNIDFLLNNVGFSDHLHFFNSEFTENKRMLDVHINCATELIHKVVPYMKSVNGGFIVNVSSLASYMPSLSDPFYSGTKAFLNVYSESIAMILKPYKIKVQSLCPGFVITDFHRGRDLKRGSIWMEPEEVVKYSFKKLFTGKVIVIPGLFYKLIYFALKVIPKGIYYRLAGRRRVLNE